MTKPRPRAKSGGGTQAQRRTAHKEEAAMLDTPETSEVEKNRQKVAEDLRKVEQQIFDLETRYLENSSPLGNAIRGYEGFLTAASSSSRKVMVKSEDRLFSHSSVHGQRFA